MEGQGTLCDFARREIQETWAFYAEQLAAKSGVCDPEQKKHMKAIAEIMALGSFSLLVEWARKGMLSTPEVFCRDMDQIILPFAKSIFSGM